MAESDLIVEKIKQILQEFEAQFNKKTADPKNFATMSDLESMWRDLRGQTNILYSDMIQRLLDQVNEKELIRKKKESSKKPESDSRITAEQKEKS